MREMIHNQRGFSMVETVTNIAIYSLLLLGLMFMFSTFYRQKSYDISMTQGDGPGEQAHD